MYAMGMLLQTFLGWDFNLSIMVAAFVVLGYTFLGGLTCAIYNEVLQFFLIVFGFFPLVAARPEGGRLVARPAGQAGVGRHGPGLRARRAAPNPGRTSAQPRPTRWASSGSAW